MANAGIESRPALSWLGEPAEAGTLRSQLQPGRRRVMRLIKYVLPLLALMLIGVMFGWQRMFGKQDGQLSVSFSGVSTLGDELSMTSPRFTGADAHNRAYVVTAATASQNMLDRAQVALRALEAEIAVSDGSFLSLRATSGEIHTKRQQLRLSGAVGAYSDLGYEFHGSEFRIDLNEGSLDSRAPVQAQGVLGRLSAATMRAEDRGQRVWFTGDVRVTIYPRPGGAN